MYAAECQRVEPGSGSFVIEMVWSIRVVRPLLSSDFEVCRAANSRAKNTLLFPIPLEPKNMVLTGLYPLGFSISSVYPLSTRSLFPLSMILFLSF